MESILAYIDPGSGSFLVQLVAAAVLGISFFFRSIRMKIRSLFTRGPKKNEDTNPAD